MAKTQSDTLEGTYPTLHIRLSKKDGHTIIKKIDAMAAKNTRSRNNQIELILKEATKIK